MVIKTLAAKGVIFCSNWRHEFLQTCCVACASWWLHFSTNFGNRLCDACDFVSKSSTKRSLAQLIDFSRVCFYNVLAYYAYVATLKCYFLYLMLVGQKNCSLLRTQSSWGKGGGEKNHAELGSAHHCFSCPLHWGNNGYWSPRRNCQRRNFSRLCDWKVVPQFAPIQWRKSTIGRHTR